MNPEAEGPAPKDRPEDQAASKQLDTAILSPAAGGIPSTPPRGPKAHKDMARQLGIRGNSGTKLIALSDGNDPFYKGTPAQIRDAQWFAEIWQRFGYRSGIHLRRVHY